MIPTTLAIILIGLGILSGFLVGWDFAVHHHRQQRKTIETNLADLEAQVATFTDDMKRDPQRAWINMGKRNVLNQMERTLSIIRNALEPES